MSYTVLMMEFREDGSVPTYRLDGSFATAEDALAAGQREIATRRTASSQLGFEIHDAKGRAIQTVRPEGSND